MKNEEWQNKKVPNLLVSGLGFLHPVSSRGRFTERARSSGGLSGCRGLEGLFHGRDYTRGKRSWEVGIGSFSLFPAANEG
ncbi:MAG: hypothetical protein HY865_17600 [Chloroflexi bacterium]|nr:hypothetical protein [Chloroflexota bacterium]